MDNPWLNLSEDSYILEEDRESIERYNSLVRDETKIIDGSVPEPFIGNPEFAKVVLLNLNPGHNEKDEEDHRRPEIREAMFSNLRHEPQEYPFYPLSPAFKGTGVEEYWSCLKIRELQEEACLDAPTFAKKLLVIEWFPYHSIRSALPAKRVCESQKYSFQLARQMLEKGVPVVGMRSKNHWVNVDQAFEKVPFLRNRRRPWITKYNMDEGLFDRIVHALKANT